MKKLIFAAIIAATALTSCDSAYWNQKLVKVRYVGSHNPAPFEGDITTTYVDGSHNIGDTIPLHGGTAVIIP